MPLLLLTTRKAYLGLIVLLLGSSFAACLLLSNQGAQAVHLSDYHIYRCETGAAQFDRTFSILTVTSVFAREVADRLCDSEIMARHYGAVSISWEPRGLLAAEQILSEEYDLIWSREHNMRGLVPEFADYYDTLLRYDHYRVYWIGRGQKPELNPAYFQSRKVGLLNDKLSHTHYLLPLASLKKIGVSLSAENIIYFDDVLGLYNAFKQGEIDLISGGHWLQEDLDLPLHYALITDDAIAATLFIRRVHSSPINCEVVRALEVWEPILATTHLYHAGEGNCDRRG
jgi:hypothetical protein